MTESAPQFNPENVPEYSVDPRYELLVGHERTDGQFKTSEQLRAQYVELTDNLVHKMVDGIDVIDAATGEMARKVPDVVVWLDKSARPISWLIDGMWPNNDDGTKTPGLWPLLAADKDGVIPPLPQFRYVNIDREQWVTSIDPTGEGYSDVSKIDTTVIRSLRSIFVAPKHKTKYAEGLAEDIDHAPAELDGKTILIIDEVRSTGRTLQYAENFFKRAFPTASVATAHWMGGQAMIGEAVGNADIPVWYNDESNRGRGVGERNEVLSGKSRSVTQRMGRFFLSTRLPDVTVRDPEDGTYNVVADPLSAKLRRELSYLNPSST
jgi:hypothetical protein